MLKNFVKVVALATVLGFAGIASAGPISASNTSQAAKVQAKAAQKAAKAAKKAAKKALKAYNKCMKRARKGKVSASSCSRGTSPTYSLAAPTVVPTAAASTSGPSCTSNCTQSVPNGAGGPTGQATEVPEPTTLALIGASLLGMGLIARRRRRKALSGHA